MKTLKKFVVDSSVVMKWINDTDELHVVSANRLLEDVQRGVVELFAPELTKYEIGNALLLGKKLSESEMKTSLSTLYSLPITFVPETETRARKTSRYVHTLKVTYYDAAFLSLAEELNTTLITDNIKHQKSAKHVHVLPLSEYL